MRNSAEIGYQVALITNILRVIERGFLVKGIDESGKVRRGVSYHTRFGTRHASIPPQSMFSG